MMRVTFLMFFFFFLGGGGVGCGRWFGGGGGGVKCQLNGLNDVSGLTRTNPKRR